MDVVEKFLSAAWLGATCICIAAVLPIKGLEFFQSMVLTCCKRGKLSPSNKFTVPQSYFTHFYIIAVIWNTLLLVASFFSCCTCMSTSEGVQLSALLEQLAGASGSAGSRSISVIAKQRERGLTTVFLLLLMELQLLRRLYESSMVFSYSPNARMHILGYLVGIFYYIAAPLSLCASDDLQKMLLDVPGLFMKVDNPGAFDFDMAQWWECFNHFGSLQWYHITGGIIFLWGWFHQYRCHRILASLRSDTKTCKEYGIPYGDWFEKVSCAHYTAEIVMYVGLVFASGVRHLPLLFLLSWVVSNLYLVARETHHWYLSTFENYPKNRRPLVPSLWENSS